MTENSRKRTKLWLIAVGIFFVLYLSRTIESNRDDFIAYFNAGLRALAGESPYQTEETPYRYLPLTAFFFSPLTFFSHDVARVIFFLINFFATIALYAQFRKKIGDRATFLIAALFFRFHNHDFGSAQINPILLVLFFAWSNFRATHLPLATLAFAVFGSFKILPYALGLPLLIRGRFAEITWIGLWTVVLNFVPIVFFSTGPFVFSEWFLRTKEIPDPVMLSNVQSLQSALWWLLQEKLSPEFFRVLIRALQALLLLYASFGAPKKNRESWMIATTLAITVISSPLAWKHSYLLFIPLVFQWFSEDPEFREKRTRLLYGIAVSGLVLLPTLFGYVGREYADRLYFTPWTGLVLILLGPWLARRA